MKHLFTFLAMLFAFSLTAQTDIVQPCVTNGVVEIYLAPGTYNYYDNGGPDGDYCNNANSRYRFFGQFPNSTLTITFTEFDIQCVGSPSVAEYYSLRVDATTITGNDGFPTLCGNFLEGKTYVANSNLLCQLRSNASGSNSGWVATITVESECNLAATGADFNLAGCEPGSACATLSPTITGGTAPFSYLWSDGSTDPTLEVCPTSNSAYSVAITDANGCEADATFNVTVSFSDLAATGADYSILGCEPGDACQVLTPTITGGTAPFSYLWSDGSTGSSLEVCPNVNSSYSVTVTDASGCEDDATFNVSVTFSDLEASGGDFYTIYGYTDEYACVTLEPTIAGGTPPYTYESMYVCPTEDTQYTITVTDYKGCTADATFNVYVENIICEAGESGEHKVYICHKENGNNPQTLCVDLSSVESHLAHGDGLGVCDADKSAVITPETRLSLYPNPTQGNATLSFTNANSGNATVSLYDVTGRMVKVLYDGEVSMGSQAEVLIEGNLLMKGINLVIYQHSDGTVMTEKLVMSK